MTTDPPDPAQPLATASGPGPTSIAAHLLLLSVGERAAYRTRGDVAVVVAAGSLADEVLGGVGTGVDGSPRALDAAIRSRSAAMLQTTALTLVGDGILVPQRHRVLGLFPRHGWAVQDVAARAMAEQRVVRALSPTPPGSPQPAAEAVLGALASVSGIARHLVPLVDDSARASYRTHLAALAVGMGPELAALVAATRRVYRRLGSGEDGGALFVSGGDRDGYGDEGGDGDAGSSSGDGGGDGGGGGD